eukprot:gene1133-1202_t
MAGRGRGATLPAWMTNAELNPVQADPSLSNGGVQHRFEDAKEDRQREERRDGRRDDRREDRRDGRREDRGGDDGRRNDDRGRRPKSRSRDRRDERRGGSRDRGARDRGGDRGRRSPSGPEFNSMSIPTWRPKKERGNNTNFDLKPPPGVELPPIGVVTPINGIPNSYLSFSNNPLQMVKEARSMGDKVDNSLHTRHGRRIYAGGIPPTATEEEIFRFFTDIVRRALPPGIFDGRPVTKVYLNTEKCYAFVEFPSIELATACMQLDGIKYEHHTGSFLIRVRRPNDYRPELLPPSTEPIPVLNSEVLSSLGAAGSGGLGKIFIGGLPYNLNDEQIMELLTAFGPLKSFHQVREGNTALSKGYAFCEYYSKEISDTAIEGLNGMPLADKFLTVRYANTQPIQPQSSLASNLLMNTPYEAPSNPVPQPVSHAAAVMPVPAYSYGNSLANNNLLTSVPTRVLKLGNMVTHDDLMNDSEFHDIREDVRLECMEYGPVLNVVVPRIKDGFPPSTEGFIYVEFAHTDTARLAAMALNGRKFADRSVMVTYFDEGKFAGRIFI